MRKRSVYALRNGFVDVWYIDVLLYSMSFTLCYKTSKNLKWINRIPYEDIPVRIELNSNRVLFLLSRTRLLIQIEIIISRNLTEVFHK